MLSSEHVARVLVACAIAMTDSGAPRSHGSAELVAFTGKVAFAALPAEGDRPLEALAVEVEVRVAAAGSYSIVGTLQKSGKVIANRPRFASALFSRVELERPAGTYSVALRFSGEQVYRSGEDGPYELVLYAIGAASHAELRTTTPPYEHLRFGELGAALARLEESARDEDGDGRFDILALRIEIPVRVEARYHLQAALGRDGQILAHAARALDLTVGTHVVSLPFAGKAIRGAGRDGPYELVVNLLDAAGHNLASTKIRTKAYRADAFGGREPDDSTDGRRGKP